jgi:hypothetical protein
MDALNEIRLSRRIIYSGKQGKPKIEESLEEMSQEQQTLMQIFNLSAMHLKPFKMQGVNSYS